jgi:hypothetical protein
MLALGACGSASAPTPHVFLDVGGAVNYQGPSFPVAHDATVEVAWSEVTSAGICDLSLVSDGGKTYQLQTNAAGAQQREQLLLVVGNWHVNAQPPAPYIRPDGGGVVLNSACSSWHLTVTASP